MVLATNGNTVVSDGKENEFFLGRFYNTIPRLVWVEQNVLPDLEPHGFYLGYVEDEINTKLHVRLMPYDAVGRLSYAQINDWLVSVSTQNNSRVLHSFQQLSLSQNAFCIVEKKKAIPFSFLDPLQPCNDSSAPQRTKAAVSFCTDFGVDNCADIPKLSFASVLFNLRLRYLAPLPHIYTFAGSVLLALNPYCTMNEPQPEEALKANRSRRVRELPPHPYSVAELCFRRLKQRQARQTVIVSGESGAGKTETAKMLIRYLASRPKDTEDPVDRKALNSTAVVVEADSVYEKLQERLLGMNPILETFGNAATVRNLNSSRFGRLNKLHFKDSTLIGAGVQTYLLERSRVTHQNPGERNFHIFYQLLQGADVPLLSHLALSRDVQDYVILGGTSAESLKITPTRTPVQNKRGDDDDALFSTPLPRHPHTTPEDKQKFATLQHAFEANGFSASELADIFDILAAILHLGNVQEKEVLSVTALSRAAPLTECARLLQIPRETLASLFHSRNLGSHEVATPRPENSRLPMVHTLMRWLYSRLFDHVIVKKLDQQSSVTDNFIAILDIYGFETVQRNSFEQLLINLANEKLQHFFVYHLILAEQFKYSDQNIHWRQIPVQTGSHVVKCLTGRVPTIPFVSRTLNRTATPTRVPEECSAVLPFLDDVGRLAASDLTEDVKSHDVLFWRKLERVQQRHQDVFKWLPKRSDGSLPFTVKHFAGDVTYVVNDWIKKDNDKIAPEVHCCLSASKNDLIQRLVEAEADLGQHIGRFNPVARRFVSELDALLTNLSATGLSFIRCFLPNETQSQGVFHGGCVARQMQQSGTLEFLRVCQLGFSFHQLYDIVYKHLLRLVRPFAPKLATTDSLCDRYPLLREKKTLTELALTLFVPKQRSDWEPGRTMLFARSPLDDALSQLITQPLNNSHFDPVKVVSQLGWTIPTRATFLGVYKRLALRPWRQIVRPLVLTVLELRRIRRNRIERAFKRFACHLAFNTWKTFTVSVHRTDCNEKVAMSSKVLDRPPEDTQYPTPWFFTWRHSLLSIPSSESVLFFDGVHLWLASVESTTSSQGKRLYFQKHVHSKDGTQRLSGPSRKRPQQTQRSVSPASRSGGASRSVEDSILGVCQHPQNLNTFVVISNSWCVLSFTLMAAWENQSVASCSKSPGKVHTMQAPLSPFVSTTSVGRRCVDLRALLTKALRRRPSLDIQSLRVLKIFFCNLSSESTIAVLWSYHKPSVAYCVPNQLLITLIDLANDGELLALFFGKLPAFAHVHYAVSSAGPRCWSSLFPRYMDLSVRPSYQAVLEASITTPLASNRGFFWSGAGFCKLFRFLDVFDTGSRSHRVVNIQLLWDSDTHTFYGRQSPKRDLWLWWPTAFVGLSNHFKNDVPQQGRPLTPTERLRATPRQTSPSVSIDPLCSESLLATTLQGTLLLFTLSLPEEPLQLHHLEQIPVLCPCTGKPLHGLLTLVRLNCDNSSSVLAHVTASGAVHLLRYSRNTFALRSWAQLSWSQNFGATPPEAVRLKFTSAAGGYNNKRLFFFVSDLPSGTVQFWSIEENTTSTSSALDVHLLGAAPLRYSRHLQLPVVPV